MGTFLDFLAGNISERKVDVYIICEEGTYRALVFINNKFCANMFDVLADDDALSQVDGYEGFTVGEAYAMRRQRNRESKLRMLSDDLGKERVSLLTREDAVNSIQKILRDSKPTETIYHHVTHEEYERIIKPKLGTTWSLL